MNFNSVDQQSDLLDAVDTLLGRHAGPDRIRALGGDDPSYDWELQKALSDAGFDALGREAEAGPLETALVLEALSARLGVVAMGAQSLVLAGLTDRQIDEPVSLTTSQHRGLVRYAADAPVTLALDLDDGQAWLIPSPPGTFERARSRFGYPMGRVARPLPDGEALGPGSGPRMLDWWRVALACELVGTMRAALALTVAYVTERVQFGRPIGSFQAVQHRLAEVTVLAEGARWLALEAAWLGAPEEEGAAAVIHSVGAARRVIAECHQLTGAIGLTSEYGLHLWTMRLAALVVEASWMAASDHDLVQARWGAATKAGWKGGSDADRSAV